MSDAKYKTLADLKAAIDSKAVEWTRGYDRVGIDMGAGGGEVLVFQSIDNGRHDGYDPICLLALSPKEALVQALNLLGLETEDVN